MQSSYCKWYFCGLLSIPNTMFAAEILQKRGSELFNRVGNVEYSLCFHVLILKEVKGKHHQPAKTLFQFFAHLNPFQLFLKSCLFLSHHWGRGVKCPLIFSEFCKEILLLDPLRSAVLCCRDLTEYLSIFVPVTHLWHLLSLAAILVPSHSQQRWVVENNCTPFYLGFGAFHQNFYRPLDILRTCLCLSQVYNYSCYL